MPKDNIKSEKKNDRLAGLGRGLSDLLDDNDGIPNMKSQVVIRRDDGSRVKIYDQPKEEYNNAKKTSTFKKW